MSPEKRIEMARKGGKAAAAGNGHKFTSAEARAAGRKGGIVSGANRAHMAEIGKRGSAAREAKRERETDDDRARAGNED
jgi:general stress protein YciG